MQEIFGPNLFLHNKTLTQTLISASSKTTFRKKKGRAESGFCLWQELRKINEKVVLLSDNSEKVRIMVREVGLEPTRFLRPADFKSAAYTNSAIRAWNCQFREKSLKNVTKNLEKSQNF